MITPAPVLNCGGGGSCDPGETCLPDDYIDPADCPTCLGDYVPLCMNETATDPSTLILASSPWAYYPMDDASGNIVDASGNGRDATGTGGGGTITYAQPGITTKRTKSILFEGKYFTLPKPSELDSAHTWTLMWLEYIVLFHGSGSPNQASALAGCVNGGTASPLMVCNSSAGDFYILYGAEGGGINSAGYFNEAQLVGRPAVITVTSSLIPTQPNAYVDGVRWISTQNTGLGFADTLCIGASDNGFWGYPKHYMSDFTIWDRGMQADEVADLSEALLDAAAMATAVKFR
jgi:hypothetical protein